MKNILIAFFISILFLSCKDEVPEPLRVGMLIWPPNEFFHLAESLGYYKDKNIELIDYRTPSEAIRAYKTGLLDAVIGTGHLYLKMNDKNLEDRILMVIDYSSGSDLLLAKPEITSMEELKGKKLGAEASALGIFVMLRFLEIYGLSPNDITHVPIDVSNQPLAYKNGLFDAVITYEPFASEMKKQGAVELSNSKEIPFEISDVLISTPTIIAQKTEQLTALCKGYFDVITLYKKNAKKFTPKLTARHNISSEDFINALGGVTFLNLSDNKKLIDTTESGYYKALSKVNEKMIAFKLINTKHNVSELIDMSIVKNIHDKN
ncbi:ABC transporter substrate-binding protein [Polaribacter sp. IC073]|uniref:ABC transporter substrate-binding protein n=1 Tax=Polaribacter sp. IC073 TaxID=2508540 RepID=UPI0011BEAF46|nr:ABC transporter substrate-binding protein [Polaribacter sp. IC073]TXD45814.1 hypothetical protein ES045_15970 [Polaribacter sp. IC073]